MSDENQKILDLRNGGMSCDAIGREIGRSGEFVRLRLKTLGWTTPTAEQRMDKKIARAYEIAPIAEIIAQHKKGAGLDRLGRKHHVKLEVLKEILRREGVEMVTKYYPQTGRYAELTEEKLRELYEVEGFSQEGIAQMFGVSLGTVSLRIRQFKITQAPRRAHPVSFVPGNKVEEFRKLDG